MNQILSFGEHLRFLREKENMTLKYVSEQISIDISLLAKIERNERQANKHLIKEVARFFRVSESDLYNYYLSDQIAYKIISENADISVLKVAEKKIKYIKLNRNGKED